MKGQVRGRGAQLGVRAAQSRLRSGVERLEGQGRSRKAGRVGKLRVPGTRGEAAVGGSKAVRGGAGRRGGGGACRGPDGARGLL